MSDYSGDISIIHAREPAVTMVLVHQDDGREQWESLKEYRDHPRIGTFIVTDKRRPVVNGLSKGQQ